MKKTNKEIIAQIRVLLDELEGGNSERSISSEPKRTPASSVKKDLPGCSGAIQRLIEEKFFDALRSAPQVVEKLKEEGQPYSNGLVSMNLLNLVKPPRRMLRRIKEEGQWRYIVRK
jgi:hypothetical protein